MTGKVSIDQIKFNKEIYPRIEADNATVNQYRESVDCLPPVLVTKDLILIDGYHRYLAHKLEGKTEISVEYFGSEDKLEILVESIRRNNSFGKQLETKEKRLLAPKLWLAGLTDVEKIASVISVTVQSANNYTRDLRQVETEKREADILSHYLQCCTFEEIAQKFNISMGTVHNIFKKEKLFKIEDPNDLQFYNIWNCGKLDTDQLKYPGQTPLEIAENIIYYYTDPPTADPLKFSKVVDPMAGSGMIQDVCKKLLRRYMLFDIKPLREDKPIIQNDILNGFPDKAKNADLVYFDPPYFNLMTEYPNNEFTKDYQSFLIAMNISFANIKKILKTQGKVALVLKPMNEKMFEGEWLDMTFDCVSIAKQQGYKILKRIAAPLSTQQFTATDLTQAKNHKAMLNTLRDIVILEAN